jgi:nitroimidazol reductase NimA-like FMN-containing flavoprotein (pyridoxamine 5'-phosphate oxidase superfamily)
MRKHTVLTLPEIENIIRGCEYCNLAMIDQNGFPYVVPMNFGYNEGYIYLHSSKQGRKIGILKSSPNVCLSFSTDHQLRWQNEDVACSYSMRFRSVIAFGKAKFVEDLDCKRSALEIIMKQYSQRQFRFNEPAVKDVAVIQVVIEKIEGRVYGYETST